MSVAMGQRQAAFCSTFVDELVRSGVTDAVVSPGSRSTPMALALLASPIAVHVRLDERSACFVALGIARATMRPVVVLVTSGTAAAELHAGVVEAELEAMPLIVLTADRPPELRGTGAAQTIDQRGLFGAHVRASIEPGPVHAIPDEAWRPLASRVVASSLVPLPGPVAVNLAFVEPLVAEPGLLPEGRSDGRPWFSHSRAEAAAEIPPSLLNGGCGIFVAGLGCGDAGDLRAAARALGWPIIADPRSGLRGDAPEVVTVADALLRDAELAEALAPDVIVIAGAPAASKVLAAWIARCAERGAELVVVGERGIDRHPSSVAADVVAADPSALWRSLAMMPSGAAPQGWMGGWAAMESAVDARLDELVGPGSWSEPAVLRAISLSAPDEVSLVVSSSMPVRDLEWFGGRAQRQVHANRGANGIDGVVSTAVGVAIGAAEPVVAVVGDLAFLHDVSVLVDGLDEERGSLVVVVLDNGGGGIFSFLPQRQALDGEAFSRLFATPRTAEADRVASAFGIEAASVSDRAGFDRTMASWVGRPGLRVLRCELPGHDDNVAIHSQIEAAAVEAARSLLS